MRSKRRVIGIIIAIVFVFLMSAFLSSNSLIEAQGTKDKQFTSIQVQKGDTLWKIAKKYMGNEYSSVDDYIEEVCQTNHIYDGKITEDMYLVIPYYKWTTGSHTVDVWLPVVNINTLIQYYRPVGFLLKDAFVLL